MGRGPSTQCIRMCLIMAGSPPVSEGMSNIRRHGEEVKPKISRKGLCTAKGEQT